VTDKRIGLVADSLKRAREIREALGMGHVFLVGQSSLEDGVSELDVLLIDESAQPRHQWAAMDCLAAKLDAKVYALRQILPGVPGVSITWFPTPNSVPIPPEMPADDSLREIVREIVREELGLIANKAPRPSTHEAVELLRDGLFRGHIEFTDGSESA
jgi:hypothetical protein